MFTSYRILDILGSKSIYDIQFLFNNSSIEIDDLYALDFSTINGYHHVI
jgi:hypothetical protein